MKSKLHKTILAGLVALVTALPMGCNQNNNISNNPSIENTVTAVESTPEKAVLNGHVTDRLSTGEIIEHVYKDGREISREEYGVETMNFEYDTNGNLIKRTIQSNRHCYAVPMEKIDEFDIGTLVKETENRDSNKDGRYGDDFIVSSYKNGNLVKVEIGEDNNHNGKPDTFRTIIYDAQGRVIRDSSHSNRYPVRSTWVMAYEGNREYPSESKQFYDGKLSQVIYHLYDTQGRERKTFIDSNADGEADSIDTIRHTSKGTKVVDTLDIDTTDMTVRSRERVVYDMWGKCLQDTTL